MQGHPPPVPCRAHTYRPVLCHLAAAKCPAAGGAGDRLQSREEYDHRIGRPSSSSSSSSDTSRGARPCSIWSSSSWPSSIRRKGSSSSSSSSGDPAPALRVVGCTPELATTTGLLSGLRSLGNLRVLQYPLLSSSGWSVAQQRQLPRFQLQEATQLEELHLTAPGVQTVADILPASLKRLSWRASHFDFVGKTWPHGNISSVAHLTQLTSLQLGGTSKGLDSSRLPPGLQRLELQHVVCAEPSELLEQQQVLQALVLTRGWGFDVALEERLDSFPEQLSQLTSLRTLHMSAAQLAAAVTRSALAQLPHLSSLTVESGLAAMQTVLEIAASISSLRHLRLESYSLRLMPGLVALTRLTRLNLLTPNRSTEQAVCAVADQLGHLAALQWLTVPAELLVQPGATWLSSLQQLVVLVVYATGHNRPLRFKLVDSCVTWLERCGPQTLPPRLQVVSLHSMLGSRGEFTLDKREPRQLRSRVRQTLHGRGCEVVVGVDLNEVGDPVQQLAGLPVALQQALA